MSASRRGRGRENNERRDTGKLLQIPHHTAGPSTPASCISARAFLGRGCPLLKRARREQRKSEDGDHLKVGCLLSIKERRKQEKGERLWVLSGKGKEEIVRQGEMRFPH